MEDVRKMVITSIRIDERQLKILKTLPTKVSASAIVRVLFDEYFEGRLPHLHGKIVEEANRAEIARQSTQF